MLTRPVTVQASVVAVTLRSQGRIVCRCGRRSRRLGDFDVPQLTRPGSIPRPVAIPRSPAPAAGANAEPVNTSDHVAEEWTSSYFRVLRQVFTALFIVAMLATT